MMGRNYFRGLLPESKVSVSKPLTFELADAQILVGHGSAFFARELHLRGGANGVQHKRSGPEMQSFTPALCARFMPQCLF